MTPDKKKIRFSADIQKTRDGRQREKMEGSPDNNTFMSVKRGGRPQRFNEKKRMGTIQKGGDKGGETYPTPPHRPGEVPIEKLEKGGLGLRQLSFYRPRSATVITSEIDQPVTRKKTTFASCRKKLSEIVGEGEGRKPTHSRPPKR